MESYWFPSPEFCASSPYFSHETFIDCDQQAARVNNTNSRFTQLTPGRFDGKSVSLVLKDIAVHIEIDNHYIEAQVVKPTDHYSFCMPLDSTAPFTMFGAKHQGHWVDIDPPEGHVDAVIPPDSTYAVISIHRHALLDCEAMLPETANWLMALGYRGALVKSDVLVRQFRYAIVTTIETAAQAKSQHEIDFLERSFILHIASSLSIAWLKREDFSQFARSAAYERFHQARNHLLKQLSSGLATQADNAVLQPLTHLGSKRSIEQAFSQNTTMGPLTYWRVMRLHNARRKLIDPKRRNQAIGDIAAEEGFWEFSRFSMQYRKHFGERPSDTRKLANR